MNGRMNIYRRNLYEHLQHRHLHHGVHLISIFEKRATLHTISSIGMYMWMLYIVSWSSTCEKHEQVHEQVHEGQTMVLFIFSFLLFFYGASIWSINVGQIQCSIGARPSGSLSIVLSFITSTSFIYLTDRIQTERHPTKSRNPKSEEEKVDASRAWAAGRQAGILMEWISSIANSTYIWTTTTTYMNDLTWPDMLVKLAVVMLTMMVNDGRRWTMMERRHWYLLAIARTCHGTVIAVQIHGGMASRSIWLIR